MLRQNRIKDYVFRAGSLTANVSGLFDSYSDNSVNGTVQSITLGSNTFTNTGSISVFLSGTDNSVQQDLILRFRVGSMMQNLYPFVSAVDNQAVQWTAGSNVPVQPVMNGIIRVVGSGLGNGTSGLYLTVRYI